jgi:hypothetical protein
LRKGGSVDLPIWQRPAAMLIALGFYGIALVAQLWSALTRSFVPLPTSRAVPRFRVEPASAAAGGAAAVHLPTSLADQDD